MKKRKTGPSSHSALLLNFGCNPAVLPKKLTLRRHFRWPGSELKTYPPDLGVGRGVFKKITHRHTLNPMKKKTKKNSYWSKNLDTQHFLLA